MSDSPTPLGQRAALVYNPIKIDFTSLSESVLRLSATAGWSSPLFLSTTPEDLGHEVTREALELGATHIMVAGGDGTVRAVSEALADSGTPLTIIPSGTGNLLARNLNLPLGKPEEMIEATFSGVEQKVDVGFADIERPSGAMERHAFVVMAGIGLDAAMIQNTSSALKKRVGWVAYVGGAARSLTQAKPFRATYRLAGHREHSARVHSILFANCGQLPAGIALMPEASIADGLIDIAVFPARGVFGWLFVWRTVWWENSVLRRFRRSRSLSRPRSSSSSYVHFLQGRWLEARAATAQPIELDGDELGEAVRMKCGVDRGALTVMMPRGSAPLA